MDRRVFLKRIGATVAGLSVLGKVAAPATAGTPEVFSLSFDIAISPETCVVQLWANSSGRMTLVDQANITEMPQVIEIGGFKLKYDETFRHGLWHKILAKPGK